MPRKPAQGESVTVAMADFDYGSAWVHPEDSDTVEEFSFCSGCHTGGINVYEQRVEPIPIGETADREPAARSAQGLLERCLARISARLALSRSRMKRVSFLIFGRSKVCQSTESSRIRSSIAAKKPRVVAGSPRMPM